MFNIGTLLAVLNLQNNMSAGLQAAMQHLQQFQNVVNITDSQLTLLGRGLREAGVVATAAFTVPIVGAAVASAKAAISFESSFAGVRKTVEGTKEELEALGGEFRKLSMEIPITIEEINAIAESGGQLGVAKEDSLEFTKTMAAMSVTTNLTAEQASTGFAKFANIMDNELGPQFDKLGATVVDLGNKSAATESEILNFGMRLAGAGKVAKMSEADILGLGTGLASLGIRAESGGTAFSKVIIGISKAVALGGKDLENYAKVAGKTADEFTKIFKKDSTEAVLQFVEGLGNIDKAGGNLFLTLDKLGVKEVRLRDALLRTASASELVRESINTGREAWEKNTALVDEAAIRYKTVESQLILLKNRINDVAIDLGNELLPLILEFIEAAKPWIEDLRELIHWFGELDPSTKKFILGIFAMIAAGGPLLIFFGQLFMAIGNISRGLSLVFGPGSITGIQGLTGASLILSKVFVAIGVALVSWQIGRMIGQIHLFGLELTRWVTVLAAWALNLGKISIADLKAVEMAAQAVHGVGRTTNIVLNSTNEAIDRIANAVDRADSPIEKMFALHDVMRSLGEGGKLSAGAMRLIATEGAKLAEGGQKLTKELQQVVDIYGKIPKSAEEAAAAQAELTKEQLKEVEKRNNVIKKGLEDLAAAELKAKRDSAKAIEAEGMRALKVVEAQATAEIRVIEKGNADLTAAEIHDKKELSKFLEAEGLRTMKAAEKQYNEEEKELEAHAKKMERIWDKSIDIMIRAFTGGGGMVGAIKALGVMIADEILQPLEAKLTKVQKMAVAVGTGITLGLGNKAELGDTANTIIGIGTGLAGSAIAAQAAAHGLFGMAAGSMGASVAAGALTLGIGAAAVGVGVLIKKWFDHRKEVREQTAEIGKFQEQVWATLSPQQASEAAGRSWAATVIGIRDAYLATGRTVEQAETDTKALWESTTKGAGASKAAIDKINLAFIEQKQEVEKLQKAVDKYGLTWRNLGQDIKSVEIGKIADDLVDDFDRLIAKGYDERAVIQGMSKDINQFVIDAVNAGTGIPPAMEPIIRKLIEVGGLTDAAARAMLGLKADTMPALADIEAAAGRYGLKLDQLGPKVHQLRITETADQIIKDFELLMLAGADVGVVIDGMKDKVQKMVSDVLKSGLAIPEAMRPLLEKMVEAGELVDENGDKLVDLSKIKFTKPLEKMVDDLIKKLDELIDKFAELAGLKLPTAPHVPQDQSPDPAAVPDYGGAQALGGDYLVSKPTLFLAGEAGKERVTFTPQGSSKSSGGEVTIHNSLTIDMKVSALNVAGVQEVLEKDFAPRIIIAVRDNIGGLQTKMREAIGIKREALK